MDPVQSSTNIIASYHTNFLHLNFKNKAGKLFAERISENKPPIQYPLAPSIFTIQAIPVNLNQSEAINWLLTNEYFPKIKDHKIIFEYHSEANRKPDQMVYATANRSKEQETMMYVADFYGHAEALKGLPQNSDCRPQIPKEKTNKIKNGYNPLRLAALEGDIKKAKNIIIQHEGWVDSPNKAGELPFDLAFQHNQESFLLHFLGTDKRLNPSISLEKAFLKAYEEKNSGQQIFCLISIANEFIQKEQFSLALKILNCALALVEIQGNYLFKKYLIAKVENLIIKFLRIQGIKQSICKPYVLDFRFRLKQAREKSRTQLGGKIIPVGQILQNLTQEFKNIFVALIKECQVLIGRPPVNWACVGMGSMARGEMCPYSDLEFAFIVEIDQQEALNYFRLLSQLLELHIINLGETSFQIFGESNPSPTPDGFCLDSAGNTPLGIPGLFELIGTPKKLAQFLTSRKIKENIILANALSNTCLIIGDEKLVEDFKNEKRDVLSKTGEEFAMKLLLGHLQEFSPELSEKKESIRAFGIKKELYRPFQEVISSLAIYYQLEFYSTKDRIEALKSKNIFSTAGADHLLIALNRVLSLRLEAHLFYNNEEEILFYRSEDQSEDRNLLYIDNQCMKMLCDIYNVLVPFYECAKEFYISKESTSFQTNNLFLDNSLTRGIYLHKIGCFREAKIAFTAALSLNPDNIQAVMYLAALECDLEDAECVLKRSKQALKLVKRQLGDQFEHYPSIGAIYNNLASAYWLNGNEEKSLKYFIKSLQIYKKKWGYSHPSVAYILENIASIYYKKHHYEESKKFLNESLTILLNLYGPEHESTLAVQEKIQQILRDEVLHETAKEMGIPTIKSQQELDRMDAAGALPNVFLVSGIEMPQKQVPYHKDRNSDNATALYELAQKYKKGMGVTQNSQKAFESFQTAASQGCVKASYQLGKCYSKGIGIKKNMDYAIKNWKIAAKGNHAKAQLMLCWCYGSGDGVEPNVTLSLQYLKMAVDQEHPGACYQLGSLYSQGNGVEQDLSKAVYYWRIAASNRHMQSCFRLGLLYRDGIGVDQDWKFAQKYFHIAADEGEVPEAQACLAHEYECGIDSKPNLHLAYKYWKMAASQKEAGALCRLGAVYAYGDFGETIDFVKAVFYWQQAAELGKDSAYYNLGLCYLQGNGVKKNVELAINYFVHAAEQGHQLAIEILESFEKTSLF